MTGEFDVAGDRFFVAFQCRPDAREESLFLGLLADVWRDHVPPGAKQTILNAHKRPSILVCNRLDDYRVASVGGRTGKVPWPIAEVGPDDYLFSCDRMRLFTLPRSWALIAIAEELVHAYLITTKDPTHINPPPIDDPGFVAYDSFSTVRSSF